MTKRRYVLFSAQYPPHVGGVERFTQMLAVALTQRGAEVHVVTNDLDGGGYATVIDGVYIHALPCYSVMGGRMPLPHRTHVYRSMLSEISSHVFDGVLVNTRFYFHSLLGMRFARKSGITPVVLDHGSAYLSFGVPPLDACIQMYEHLITAYGKRYQAQYYGISQKSCEWLSTFHIDARGIISNSIDASLYRAQASSRDFRTEFGISRDALLVAFVGRLIPEKGVATIIDLARNPEICKRGVRFIVAGGGPMEEDVSRAGGSLSYGGTLAPDDVAALLSQADLMCLPSRSEGFATCLLEAAACGTPSVVTDVGGAREIIVDSRYGSIIAGDLSDGFSSAICRYADNRSLLKEAGILCRAHVEREFSWDCVAAHVEEAFSRASAA